MICAEIQMKNIFDIFMTNVGLPYMRLETRVRDFIHFLYIKLSIL